MWTPAPSDEHSDDEEIEVELRSSAEVRTRILLLAAVLRRLALEGAAREGDHEAVAAAFDEREWLREHGLYQDLTPGEAALLASPPGSVTSEAFIEASWQGETLGTLGWAIRALDMPPPGMLFDVRQLIESVPRPWDNIQPWLGDGVLVSEQEAVREREVAEIWHWRATAEVMRRGATAADSQALDEAIREVAAEASASGLVRPLHQADFVLNGRSMREVSPDDLDRLIVLITQRLHALNWLCGFGSSWDDVDLDV